MSWLVPVQESKAINPLLPLKFAFAAPTPSNRATTPAAITSNAKLGDLISRSPLSPRSDGPSPATRPDESCSSRSWEQSNARSCAIERGTVRLRTLPQLHSGADYPLEHREPGGGSEEIDRVLETAPGREGEPAGDHDHALGAAAEADVALEPKQLRLRARVGDEEGPGHRDYCEGERDLVPVA